jgi:hypothetical protein
MLVINRLGKVTNNSIGQSADSINVIGLGSNDDRGNRVPGFDEVPVEFDPGHRTHIDVRISTAVSLRRGDGRKSAAEAKAWML